MSQVKPAQSYIDEERAGVLLEKWAPVLDYSSDNVKAIDDDHSRLNTAILLENQEAWCMNESNVAGGSSGSFGGLAGGNLQGHPGQGGAVPGGSDFYASGDARLQQTYFSYALGKYGFDLVSWFTLKNWLDTRRKLLSQDYYYRFDDRNQSMYLTPEPGAGKSRTHFYGIVGAYVERPVKDIVREAWVYQYALALTKINIGRIRGK